MSKYHMASIQVAGMNFTNSQYGEVERQIIQKVSSAIAKLTDNRKFLLYLTTFWDHDKFREIKNSAADVVLLFNGTDAIDPDLYWCMRSPAWYELKIDKQVAFIGCDLEEEIFCDFWAITTNQYFKQYTEADVQPSEFTNIFLNYNRKPSWIRKHLLTEFVNSGMDRLGHVTLGINNTDNPDLDRFVLPPEDLSYIAGGEGDVELPGGHRLSQLRVANDIFSLGNLDVWNSCFLNVVTETTIADTLWTSEKIFKPMIGMRPFFYVGNTQVLQRLEQAGFDIFRDINLIDDEWFKALDVDRYHASGRDLYTISDHLIQVINNLKTQDLNKLYQDILPRLKHNRDLFLKYSANALIVFENNLNDYLRAN